MANVQFFGPYIFSIAEHWPPGTTWTAFFGHWPASSDGTVTVSVHPLSGHHANIAVVETKSRVDTYGSERYIEAVLRNDGSEPEFAFHAYVSLVQA